MYSKWNKRSCLTGWILSYFLCLRVLLSSHAASWSCQQKSDGSERKSELIRITFSPIRSIVYWMCLWLVALLIAVTSREHTWVVISPGWLELEYICRSLMTFRIFLNFSLKSGNIFPVPLFQIALVLIKSRDRDGRKPLNALFLFCCAPCNVTELSEWQETHKEISGKRGLSKAKLKTALTQIIFFFCFLKKSNAFLSVSSQRLLYISQYNSW